MSSLLEEAIVDAKALKDAALKNAENAVLEKYSVEVKSALSTLLEQDEFGLEEEAPAADTTFADNIPFAFQNEILEAPGEDDLIEINFDSLKARIAEEEEAGIEPTPDEMMESEEVAEELAEAAGTPGPDDVYQAAGKSPEDEVATGSNIDAAAVEQGKKTMEKMGIKESDDEDIDLTEEMIADLIEELIWCRARRGGLHSTLPTIVSNRLITVPWPRPAQHI